MSSARTPRRETSSSSSGQQQQPSARRRSASPIPRRPPGRVPLGDWARDALGLAADAFLGSQGDPWDAQWDMLCCLVGAIASMLAFAGASGIHERQLERLKARDPAP